MQCKKCGTELSENAKFCFECGEKVIKELKCKQCGNILMPNSKFCDECGAKVNASTDSSVSEKVKQQVSSIELMKFQGFVEYKGSIFYATKADKSGYYNIIKFDTDNREKTILAKGFGYNTQAGYGCTSHRVFNIMGDYLYYQNYVESAEDSKFDYIVSKVKIDGTNKVGCVKVDKKTFDSYRFIAAFHGNIIYELYKEDDTGDNCTYGYYLYNCSTQASRKFDSKAGEIIGASNTEFVWNNKSECNIIDFVNNRKYNIEDKYKNIKRDELLFVDCYKNISYCIVGNKYFLKLNLNSNSFNFDFEKIVGKNANGEIVSEWIINNDLKPNGDNRNDCNVLWICFDGSSLVALVDMNRDRKYEIIVCEKDGSYKEIYSKETLATGKIHLHNGYVYFMESFVENGRQENLISRIKVDGSGYLSNIEKFR